MIKFIGILNAALAYNILNSVIVQSVGVSQFDAIVFLQEVTIVYDVLLNAIEKVNGYCHVSLLPHCINNPLLITDT